MGMEDKRLSHHYPCHTDMITYSLSAHKHSIPHFLEKLKKTIKTCEHWGLYKYLTCAMCKRGDVRMDPFAMDFDDKEENKEMTDNDDFTDMTPEYMFQKFELVLFLLADKTAYLGSMSQLRLQDKLNISDGSVFCIQHELGPVGENDKRLVLYKMFVGLLQDVGMCKVLLLLQLAIWWRFLFCCFLSVLNFWGMFVRVYPKIVQGLTFLNSVKHITIILAHCTS